MTKHDADNQLGVAATSMQILKLAAPISIALLIPQLNFFTNTIFLGRLGVRELGVNGLTGVFYLVLAMIGYGLSSGMQIQMARRAGEGDKQGLAQVFTNGLMLSVLFSLGLMVLTLWFVPLIFGYSLQDSNDFSLSVNFIYIRVWGLPFLMITQLLSSFFISINQPRLLTYGSIVATVSNIVFDYVFIFGKFGFPNMGIQGAAVASVISELLYCIAMVALFFYHRHDRNYPVLRYGRFDWELSQRTLKVASPLIVQFIFSIGGWLVFFILVEQLGGPSLAASQVLRNIFGILSVGTWALATTCNTMVSNLIGQGRQREVMSIILKICKLSLAYAAVVCIVLLAFSRQFLSIYSDDLALIEFSIPSLRVIVVAALIMSLATVIFNGVVGTGNTMVNLVVEVTCVSIYLVYCYFIIRVHHSPLYLCWGSEFVYWGSLLILSSIYLRTGKWKNKRI